METALQRLEKEVLGFPDQAKLIIVHDNKTLGIANDFKLFITQKRKQVSETFDPIIDKTHQAHKEAVAQKKKYDEPLVDAAKINKLQIISYLDKLEKIRREAEEIARKEEEERKRIEEEKMKAALEASNSGDIEEATRIIKEEIPEQKTYIPVPSAPTLEGMSIREIWKWRTTNIKQVPREYLIVDSVKVGSLVRATKGKIRIPGIETYPEKV